jgi:hypothetical protein
VNQKEGVKSCALLTKGSFVQHALAFLVAAGSPVRMSAIQKGAGKRSAMLDGPNALHRLRLAKADVSKLVRSASSVSLILALDCNLKCQPKADREVRQFLFRVHHRLPCKSLVKEKARVLCARSGERVVG